MNWTAYVADGEEDSIVEDIVDIGSQVGSLLSDKSEGNFPLSVRSIGSFLTSKAAEDAGFGEEENTHGVRIAEVVYNLMGLYGGYPMILFALGAMLQMLGADLVTIEEGTYARKEASESEDSSPHET